MVKIENNDSVDQGGRSRNKKKNKLIGETIKIK